MKFKKLSVILILILSVCCTAALSACKVQKKGDDPSPTPKKTYTVTYDANGGRVSKTKQTVTLGEEYSLLVPTRTDYTFVCWNYNNVPVGNTGIWTIESNVTLKAEWLSSKPSTYSIIFVQTGCPNITKTLNKGETLDPKDVPTPVSKTGYTVKWDVEDFSNINTDTIVHAIETANEYKIYCYLNNKDASFDDPSYVYDEGKGAYVKTVKYQTLYSIATPNLIDHDLKKWVIKNSETTFNTSGIYTTAGDTEIVAVWSEIDPWTPRY